MTTFADAWPGGNCHRPLCRCPISKKASRPGIKEYSKVKYGALGPGANRPDLGSNEYAAS